MTSYLLMWWTSARQKTVMAIGMGFTILAGLLWILLLVLTVIPNSPIVPHH